MAGFFTEASRAALENTQGLEADRVRGAVEITGGPTVIATFAVPVNKVALVPTFSASMVSAAAPRSFHITLKLEGVIQDCFVLSGGGTTALQHRVTPYVKADSGETITVEAEMLTAGASVMVHAGFPVYIGLNQ